MQSSNVLIVTKYYRLQIPSGMFRTDYFIRLTSRSYTSHFSFDLFYHIFDFLSVDETLLEVFGKILKLFERNHIKYIHEKQQRKDYRPKSKPELPLDIQFGPFAGQKALATKPTIFAGEKIPTSES